MGCRPERYGPKPRRALDERIQAIDPAKRQFMNGHQIDLWIVIAYLLLMLGIAFWNRRFARASLENFFLGGRKIPGWLNGISYTAALISPDAATGYGGLAMVTGAFISWWYLSRFGL